MAVFELGATIVGGGMISPTPIDSNNRNQASIEAVKEVGKPISKFREQEREKEEKKKKRKADAAAASENLSSSGSPPEKKYELAESFVYETKEISEDNGETFMRIEAVDSQGHDTGDFLNARIQSDGRVYISDTVVSEAHREHGVASSMLQTLESRLPNGTELYFIENQAEGFWEKKGFELRQNNEGNVEYYKKVVHEQ